MLTYTTQKNKRYLAGLMGKIFSLRENAYKQNLKSPFSNFKYEALTQACSSLQEMLTIHDKKFTSELIRAGAIWYHQNEFIKSLKKLRIELNNFLNDFINETESS